MITEQQYKEAQEIVDAWNEQEWIKALSIAKFNFPIGCYVKSNLVNREGEVADYHKGYNNEVILRVKDFNLICDIYAKNALKKD